MKKLFYILLAALPLIGACDKENKGNDGTPLTVNFSFSPEMIFAGDAVSFTADVKGGKEPYTYEWTIRGEVQTHKTASVTYTFKTNGSEIVLLKVTDAAGSSAEKKKAVVINSAKIPEVGDLTLNWVGRMGGYNSISSVAIADDGSVYSTCQDNYLYKWSADGSQQWKTQILSPKNGGKTQGTPSVDTDGTVFIGAGNAAGDGTLKAFKPDGSVKWSFSSWWASSGTPTPSCRGVIAAIDGSNIYFGHIGTNGIVTSIDKTTGERHGFASPAGGSRNGIVISKAGTVHWYGGQYGLFGMEKSALDAGGSDKLNHKWRIFGDGAEKATVTVEGQIACLDVNGVPCVAGIATDEKGTKVYVAKAADGEVVSVCYIDDTDAQDQGGVVVDASGNLVASLNYTLGQDNGGIVIINPSSGSVVSRFRTQEKVSGSPAVDKAGNIHFGTESGYYYIVKPDGSNCELLVKRNLANIILADSRYASSFADLYTAKIWCSPVIGDDGRMYICFTDDDTRAFGGVVSLSYSGCAGPANSDWPMVGHDRRHTSKQ